MLKRFQVEPGQFLVFVTNYQYAEGYSSSSQHEADSNIKKVDPSQFLQAPGSYSIEHNNCGERLFITVLLPDAAGFSGIVVDSEAQAHQQLATWGILSPYSQVLTICQEM